MDNKSSGPKFTPESTKAWSLALYPAAILGLTVFLVLAEKPITTDVIALFIGLLSAGTLQAAVNRTGGVKNGESSGSNDSGSGVRRSSSEELAPDDRRGTNNFDRWRDRDWSIRWPSLGGLSARS